MSNLAIIRTIKIFSTKGQSGKEIQSSATKWGDLKQELLKDYPNLNNMKAVLMGSNHTLESTESLIPSENVIICLMPLTTKSGATEKLDSKSIRADIKAAIKNYGDKAKKHFTIDGKNYTNLSAEVNNKNLISWNKENNSNKSTTSKAPVKVPTKKAIATKATPKATVNVKTSVKKEVTNWDAISKEAEKLQRTIERVKSY